MGLGKDLPRRASRKIYNETCREKCSNSGKWMGSCISASACKAGLILMMLALILPPTRLMLMMLVSGGGWLLTLFDLWGLCGVGWGGGVGGCWGGGTGGGGPGLSLMRVSVVYQGPDSKSKVC